MPPKKKGKGASKATSTPARASTRSEGPTVLSTVTTNRSKEIETTAALARPRRAAAATETVPAPVTKTTKAAAKAPAKKVAQVAVASPPRAKKRGRPAKVAAAPEVPELTVTEKRSRPAKATAPAEDAEDVQEPPSKRSRTVIATEPTPKRKPGRPAKAANKATKPKADPEEAPAAPDTPARRKRRSGPKGGETTKIATDDADAADQLEDELVDAAEDEATTGQKRKASIKGKGKGKGKGKAVANDDEVHEDAGKNYWLMKAEQVDREVTLKSGGTFNAKFTIDDLKAATEPEAWDGVRNLVARNNMRAMKAGDLAFFYASQAKGKLVPGITGIMEVVREHEPDQSVFNEDSYGYLDPAKRGKDGDENPWSVVHVEFRKKLTKPVTLKELQKYGGENGPLGKTAVLKQSRLSVCKMTEPEWVFIVDNLIASYEDEDEAEKNEAAAAPATGAGTVQAGENADAPVNGDSSVHDDVPMADDLPAIENTTAMNAAAAPVAPAAATVSRPASRASRQASLAPPVISTTETVETTHITVEMAIDSAAPTSRPASRAGSKKPASRDGSKKPASRATSLKPVSQPPSRANSLAAPDRPASRGRSRTPKPHAAGGAGATQHMESVMEEETITTEQLDQMMG